MTPINFSGANKHYAAPKNWQKGENGECATLSVFETTHNTLSSISSIWQPSEEEKALIVAGHGVVLTILGSAHPVVSMGTTILPCKNIIVTS